LPKLATQCEAVGLQKIDLGRFAKGVICQKEKANL
jgi:hypothetical protein